MNRVVTVAISNSLYTFAENSVAGCSLLCEICAGLIVLFRVRNRCCKMALQVGVRRSGATVLRCLSNVLDGHPVLAVAGGTVKLPVATLRATFGEKYPYEEPFPYEEWPMHNTAFSFDYTEWRFNENSKVQISFLS